LAVTVVAVDAASGGSSHVTHSLGTGLPGDLAHRWRVSYDGATRSIGAFIMFASGVVLLALVALARPRPRALDAMLVALLVSFVVIEPASAVAVCCALGGSARPAVGQLRVRIAA